ncbi:MAG: hypothetical protein DLM69_11900 [Candidatus Chloroheliales bacterium]|nr:MAG: hypothetical protein DLM69_11900 [Chloroflexota bacterium]
MRKLATKISEAGVIEGERSVQNVGPTPTPGRRAQSKATEDEVLRLVGELGEVSVSQVHQRLSEGGTRSITYLAVGSVLRELGKRGQLAVQRDRHRLLYRLRGPNDDASATLLSPAAVTAPRPRRMPPHRVDVQLTPLEGEVLAAIGKLGTTNLDQLYRTRPGGRGFTYAEVVRAVHRLVQHRLVSRIHERNRYFYLVGE